jgi:D-lyxose ketol-isomerase
MSDDIIDRMRYKGAQRDAALRAMREQLAAWDVAPPASEPLLLDFGLDDWDNVGLIELWICNEAAAGYCGKYMFVQDGQQCPLHSHRVKHETFFVVHGQMKVMLDGEETVLSPSDTQAIEPGRVHSFEGCGGPALLLELSMPCEVSDNYFVDPRSVAWLKQAARNS